MEGDNRMENMQKNIERNLQSSKKHSYNLHSPGVRTYKDSVFCRIFNEKKELLSLYNALNMSHYENPDDLEIITLDNALFLQMKNDVAFLINTNEMCLIEHSSTVCLNYPLRSLLYLAREYEVILEQRNENILKYGLVKIPTPACIVLYNGMKKRPEVEILKLSDAFENQEVEPCLELFVKVLNINDGMNENVLNGCKTLKDYVILISKIRENYNEIGDLAKAIHKAVDYCIDADHLRSFLIRNRAEVEPMLLSEGTVEEYVDSMNEVKEQEIERLKKVVQEKDEELSKVTQEKDNELSKKDEELIKITQEKNEALSQKNSEIARLKALLAAKENN